MKVQAWCLFFVLYMNAVTTGPEIERRPLTDFQLSRMFWAIGRSRPILPVDAVLIYARSHGGDDDGMLELAARYIELEQASKIVLNGGDGSGFDPKQSAWPGYDDYCTRLLKLGVPIQSIIKASAGRHTREESEAFVKVIREHGFFRVASVNQFIFQPRILLGLYQELYVQDCSAVRVFADSPLEVDWSKEVFGTQGQPPALRHTWWENELRKIEDPGKFADRFITVDDLTQRLIAASD